MIEGEAHGRPLRDLRLEDIKALRERIRDQIRTAESAQPCLLGAVDSASIAVPFGDQLSILLQTVHVGDDGTPMPSDPQRVTGINGHETRLVEMPIRVAAECRELAKVTTPTIASPASRSGDPRTIPRH